VGSEIGLPEVDMKTKGDKKDGIDRWIQNVHRTWERKIPKQLGYNKSNPDLYRELEHFLQTPFPSDARGREVDGIDLVLIHSILAECLQNHLQRGLIDGGGSTVLEDHLPDLARIVPLLDGDIATYFDRLLDLGAAVLNEFYVDECL
jgi:hypothetical protein